MTDIVTYCDINTCEDCPRYGDDCDGDKRVEHTDLISRADAIEAALGLNTEGRVTWKDAVIDMLDELPSAEAKPTVIRSKTLLPTKDFKEWAKRVRDGNPNVIVIPCDAEVVSADAVQGWIPVSERLPEDIRPVLVTWKNNDPASYYQYIVGKHFIGTAHYCKGKWYWYSSVTEDLLAEYGKCDTEEFDEAIEAVAWMPLPKPYKGGDNE